MTQEELINVFRYIATKCDLLINNDEYKADTFTQDTVEDIGELCSHILDGDYGKLVELQEESVSNDLEEAVDGYTRKVLEKTNLLIGNQPVGEEISKAVKFGAKWQKEKMMAKAINTKADYTMSVPSIHMSLPLGINVGDKLKVIVIKDS